MQKVYEVFVDTQLKSKHNNIVFNTNDLNTAKLVINIAQALKPLDLTGATVRLAIVKPDKKSIFQDITIVDAAKGKCEAVLTTQAYMVKGVHVAEVMVYKGSDTATVTSTFTYSAAQGLLNEGTAESKNEWQSIHKAIADAEGILADLRENGTGVDAQARADLQKVNADLAHKANKEEVKAVDTRINNLIINNGDSSAEVLDSRVDTENVAHDTLNERLVAEIDYLRQFANRDDLKVGQARGMKLKNKALVIPDKGTTYTNNAIDQLRKSGFLLEMTSPFMFARHEKEFDHDILMLKAHTIIPHYVDMSAQSFKDALIDWLARGKKVIFLAESSIARIEKANANGETIENVSMNDILSFVIAAVSRYDRTGEFVRMSPGELTGDDFINEEFKPQNFVIHCYGLTNGVKPLVRATQNNNGTVINADCVVYKPNQFVFIGYGGFTAGEQIKNITGFRYVDAGLLAKRLLGDQSFVSLATDCKDNKKIAASGIDNDATDDKEAAIAIVEAYKGRPLEMGLHVSKLTPTLANFYRSFGNVELVSHSSHHTITRKTITDEVHEIPAKQFIRLDAPFVPTIEYIKTVDDATTFTLGSTVLTAGKYTVDDFGVVTFHSSDIGKRIKIKYTHLAEQEEWVGSVDRLRAMGALTNKAVYTTLSYKSVHPTSHALMKRENITLCHYEGFPQNDQFNYIAMSGIFKKFTPGIGSALRVGEGEEGFDHIFYRSKNLAKTEYVPRMLNHSDSRKIPYLWYSHDFIFSKDYYAGIWTDTQKRYDADWKKATYKETVEYAKEMVSWFLNQLDERNVYWMVRSDYSRWFEALNESIEYSVERNDQGVIDIYVKNKGKETLKGVTFRVENRTAPASVYAVPSESLPFVHNEGETRISIDLPPGIDRMIRLEF